MDVWLLVGSIDFRDLGCLPDICLWVMDFLYLDIAFGIFRPFCLTDPAYRY